MWLNLVGPGGNAPAARESSWGCYSMSYPTQTFGAWVNVDYDMPNVCFDRYCNGAKYVGMQDFTCFCTDISPSDRFKIEDAKCDIKCKNLDNDSGVLCGGKDGMSVYEILPAEQ